MKTKKPNLLELSIGTPICYYQRQQLPCSLFSTGNKFQASLPEFIIFKIKKSSVSSFQIIIITRSMKRNRAVVSVVCTEGAEKAQARSGNQERSARAERLRDQVTEGVSCKLTENTDR